MTEKEFQEIVSTTKMIVLSTIQKYIYSEFYYAIDDIVQETYIRVYKAIEKNKFRKESKLSTWIYVIAKNETIRMNNKLQKEEKKKAKLKDTFQQTVSIEDSSEEKMFSKNLLNKEYALSLADKLPKTYSALMKYYIEGYSIKEISEKLNLNKGTVKSRTSRGKEKLQQLMNSSSEAAS